MASGVTLTEKQQGEIIGCGAFIPGAGPGNFPDFNFGPPVDGPGPDDPIIVDPPDPDPIDDPVRPPSTDSPFPSTSGTIPGPGTPSTPGGGVGPGVTPGTGGPPPAPPTGPTGPTTPGTGPTGPTTPGTGGPLGPDCACTIENPDAVPSPITGQEAGVQVWTVEYTFSCTEDEEGQSLSDVISTAFSTLQANSPNSPNPNAVVVWTVDQEEVGSGASPGEDCSEEVPLGPPGIEGVSITITQCTGDCNSVVVTFTKTTTIIDEPDEPTDPGVIDDDNVAPGGPVIVDPEEPEEPEDPIDPGPIDGGSVSGGPELGTPFDTDGITEIKAGLGKFELENGVIDLTNPDLKAFLQDRSSAQDQVGAQDSEIAFSFAPKRPELVYNPTGNELFAEYVDSSVHYLLTHNKQVGDWDSQIAASLTPQNLYSSLNDTTKNILAGIKHYNGDKLTQDQIYTLIGSRLLDGTISEVTLPYLSGLKRVSELNTITQIIPSESKAVNETVAQALIEQHAYSLDPDKSVGVGRQALPSYQPLATDIDNHVRVNVGNTSTRLYSRDNRTLSRLNPVPVRDGNYIDVVVNERLERLYLESEVDHAFTLPENVRDQVVSLLGGKPERILEVSANVSSNIEYEYSLSTPRQPYYALSCVLDTITTSPNDTGSFLLKDTKAKYQLVDLTTQDGIDEFNDYIRFKANRRVFTIDDEDLLLDYVEDTSSLYLTQTDIVSHSKKENKKVPILTREIPLYILLYPTNRAAFNVFKTKSQVVDVSDDIITRQLRCRRNISTKFNQSEYNSILPIQVSSQDAVNVFNEQDKDTRVIQFNPSDPIFSEGYKDASGNIMSASAYTPSRNKTGLRLINEITSELSSNYVLERNAVGNLLTEFDVYSRFKFREFNRLVRLENFSLYKSLISKGFFGDIRIIPPQSKSSPDIVSAKTSLRRRVAGAPEDTFTQQKRTNSGKKLIPPTISDPGQVL